MSLKCLETKICVGTVSIHSKACLYQFHDASKGVKAIKQMMFMWNKKKFDYKSNKSCLFYFILTRAILI